MCPKITTESTVWWMHKPIFHLWFWSVCIIACAIFLHGLQCSSVVYTGIAANTRGVCGILALHQRWCQEGQEFSIALSSVRPPSYMWPSGDWNSFKQHVTAKLLCLSGALNRLPLGGTLPHPPVTTSDMKSVSHGAFCIESFSSLSSGYEYP